jgi:DNA-binding transcriptional MocR family regulator
VAQHIVLQLDEDSDTPIFLNLASVIIREIERGRLKPSAPLPGTRALSKSLGIHRNTADAAYKELNGEWQAKQNISGETDPNSGGNVVYLSPGMRIASSRWSGFATVGIPIINDLNGLQSEPTYRLFGGVLVGF